jgi:tRNA modification GTPase
VFRPNQGRGLEASPVGRLRVGRIGAGLGDEVVAVVVEGRIGLEVEVQCHGGPSAVGLVVEALVQAGARVRSPRAWLRQSTGSSLRADAEVALASAPTARVAEILMDQAAGALELELRRIAESPTEDALTGLDALIDRGPFGTRLVDGWRVVLAGRPNVGKSRLLNALAGYDRAIVAAEAGTTRDVVTVRTAFDGWPVEVADTAGLRQTLDPIEALGQSFARSHQRLADLVVVVLDRSEPLTDLDHAVLADYPHALLVASKADLPPSWSETSAGALAVSAEQGVGIETLVQAIAARLVPEPPPADAGVPFRNRHLARLRAIRQAYQAGQDNHARHSIHRWINL